MSVNTPLEISQALLTALSAKMFRYYEDRIAQDASMLIVSNHRSFMDAPILIAALSQPIRFACHHYMGYGTTFFLPHPIPYSLSPTGCKFFFII
jgi:1-acyl-sn-glycerol-3-phosphate acyltransferase